MTYEYECECGNRITRICRVAEHVRTVECECGRQAAQVIDFTVLRDSDIPWMPSAVMNLPDSKKPILTRQDWKRHLKENHLECVG